MSDCCSDDYVVCTCMEVMRLSIIKAIQQGACTFEELSDVLGVGTGCSSCVEEVREILEQELLKRKR